MHKHGNQSLLSKLVLISYSVIEPHYDLFYLLCLYVSYICPENSDRLFTLKFDTSPRICNHRGVNSCFPPFP